MLKKLISHEWHDCWRLMAVVNGLVLLLAFVGVLIFNTNMYQAFQSESGGLTAVGIVLYSVLFFLSIGALGFVVSLYFYIRFYQNLYTDQGYLMQTLPVTPSMLIISKTVVAVAWQFISSLVILVSIGTVMIGIIGATESKSLFEAIQQIMQNITWPEGMAYFVFAIIFTMFVSCIFNVFLGYTAVSLGQFFRKQKVIGSIACYIGLYTIIQIISSFATVFFPMVFDEINMDAGLTEFSVMFLILGAVLALVDVGLFYVNEYIMRNKLNLD